MPASRSLIALLVGTVVFFALWIVALKPSSSTTGGSKSGSSQGLGAYQSDINKAHQAVGISNASNAASGNENATSSSSSGGTSASQPKTTTTTVTSKPASKATSPSTPATTAQRNASAATLSTVRSALSAHKVLALLFYNPSAADDQAVKQELSSVSSDKGQVVKLAIPLNEAASFAAVTQQVPLNFSPTVVVISRAGVASEITGYSDSFEINQRVATALAS